MLDQVLVGDAIPLVEAGRSPVFIALTPTGTIFIAVVSCEGKFIEQTHSHFRFIAMHKAKKIARAYKKQRDQSALEMEQ